MPKPPSSIADHVLKQLDLSTDISTINTTVIGDGMKEIGSGVGGFIASQVSNYFSDPFNQLQSVHTGVEILTDHWDTIADFFSGNDVDLHEAPELVDMIAEMASNFSGTLTSADWTDLFDSAEELLDGLLDFGEGIDTVASGLLTFGASIAASYGVKKMFEHINKEEEQALKIQQERVSKKLQLRKLLISGAPADQVSKILQQTERQHWKI